MVKVLIDKVIVTKKFFHEKSGKTFITVTDGTNELNMSCGDLDPNAIPTLEPFKFDAEIKASMFGRNQSLTLLKLNVANLDK